MILIPYKKYNKSLYDDSYFLRTQKRTETHGFFKEMDLIIESLQLKDSDTVLDVGCGTCSSMKYIKSRYENIQIVGVEPSFSAIKNYCPGMSNILNGYAQKLPFKDNTFTKVYLNHVIGHIDDIHEGLKEIRRIMKTDGRLAIVTPRLLYRRVIYFKNLFDNFKPDPTVLRYYSESKLRKHLSLAGFKKDKVFAFDFQPNNFIERMIKKRIMGLFVAA